MGTKVAQSRQNPWKPDRLPPFPAVAIKALRMLSRDNAALQALYELIRPEPVFSSEVLRLANSALFSFPVEITSVLQAFMLLGTDKVKNVITTVGLRTYIGNSITPALRACWRHTLACAMIAEESAKWSPTDKDFAYTAAIMHDIGRVSLIATFPQPYAQLLENEPGEPRDLLESERERLGIDHCEAGRALATAWQLPAKFLEITSRHHHPATCGEDVACVVQRSCLLADRLGFGIAPFRSLPSYEELLAEFPDRARQRLPANGEELATEIASKIDCIES